MGEAAAEGSENGGAVSPLGQALGLNEQELETLGTVFNETTQSMGIDGAPIFAKLRQGESLGSALGLPPGLRELLYARAHRWFSFGRVDRAEPLFRALCILAEGSADHWVGYGVCLRLRDNLDQAEFAFATAARLRTDWAIPHFHALELALHRQRWADAQAHLALYNAWVSDDTPEAIRAEVGRFRAALALKQAGNGS